jgi:hypothetical protein
LQEIITFTKITGYELPSVLLKLAKISRICVENDEKKTTKEIKFYEKLILIFIYTYKSMFLSQANKAINKLDIDHKKNV